MAKIIKSMRKTREELSLKISEIDNLIFGASDGIRTRDPQNHNLML